MPNFNCQVSRSAIAFIDSQVADYQSLIAGVKPGTEVVVLDRGRDAIEQITEILGDRQNIDSIHIISHGAPGSLQIGNGSFCAGNLSNYSQQLQRWQSAFSQDAEILIYGCNVASVSRICPTVRQEINSLSHSESRWKPTGDNFNKQSNKQLNQQSLSEDFRYETGVSTPGAAEEYAVDNEGAIPYGIASLHELESDIEIDGFAFIKRIAQLTNTNVAASKNLTGNTAKGGDWELETTTGKIETPLAFHPEVLAAYNCVLATFGTANNFGVRIHPQFVTVSDFNGDGKPDLAVPNRSAGNPGSTIVGNVSILLGTVSGSFGTATNFVAGTRPFATTTGDFNADSKPDLAVANWGSNNVSIMLGTGTGSFNSGGDFAVGTSPWSVAAGDFNADGFLDLATANTDSNNVSVLLGTGTGSFGPVANFIVGTQPQSLAAGDFNTDGKLDLAVANYGSNNLSILLGSGTGSFGAAANFNVGTNPFSLTVGDFNKDSKPDIATANETSSNVSILLGTGTGSFGGVTNFGVGPNPRSVAAGDFNADGFLDLATANGVASETPVANNLSILLGTGTGTFSPVANYSLGSNPWTVTAADLNADGTLDLATSNYWTENVSVLLNTTPVVNFGAATYTGNEGSGDTIINLPVTISGTRSAAVTVPIVVSPNSTATQNSDYTFSPTTVTFPAGNTNLTQNVAVTIKPDNLLENAETAILDFGTITGGVAGKTKQTTLTIAANDRPLNPTPYQIDLKTGAITGQPNPFISLVNNPTDSNADGWLEAVAKINFDGNVKKARFIVEYDKAPSGWTVNLGDSQSNDGYGGDGSNQSRDAEMQILNGSMAVFGNDYNTPPGGELPQGNVPNFVSNGSRVELEISNENLAWDNKTGLKNSLNSPYLYALNGQADDGGSVNSEIYAGFNRVILDRPDRLGSGASKVTILLNPIDYAVSAGVATVTEGNSGKTGVTFTVTRSGCTEFASKIDYAIAGTATNVSDYNNIGGTSGATGATGTINFAAGETSKTITLDVLGDVAIEPNETLNVTLSNPSGLDATPTITAAVATTTVANDDAGVIVNPTGLTTSEVGGKAEFTVKLKSQPTADITFGLSSSNPAEGTISTNSLTFTPANWNQEQKVTVTGVDDLVADGDRNYTIITAPGVSTDPLYNNLNPDDVAVTNSDNETPGITVNPIAGLTTTEAGGTANFTIVLNTQPTDDVTIRLNSDKTAEGTVSTPIVTFTPANWNEPKQVTVTGVNDSIADGDIEYKIITANTVSTDPNYSDKNVPDVSLSNQDKDSVGVSVTPTQITATEGGANGTYNVVLKSQPTDPVTVNLTTGNQIQPIAPLTFTEANWNIAQPVTVIAVDDAIVEGSHSGIITHTVTSADAKYNGIAVAGVIGAIVDKETGTGSGGTGTGTGTGSGGTGTGTGTGSGGTGTDTGTGSGGTGTGTGTGSGGTGTGTGTGSGTGSGTGTGTGSGGTGTDTGTGSGGTGTDTGTGSGGTGTDTGTESGGTGTGTGTGSGTGSGGTGTGTGTGSGGTETLGSPGIIISPSSGLVTTESGGTDQFTIRLNSQPKADVRIDLRSSNEAEGVISTESITFNSANWSQPKTITITGVSDRVFDRDKNYQIVTAPAVSGDSDYNGLDAPDALVTNRDNDIPKSNARIANVAPTVSFSKATYKVNESRTGVVQTEITLTRTGDNLNKISKVYIEPPTGSATEGTDWNFFPPNFSREITFNPDEETQPFTIDILSDGQAERTEKIEFRIVDRENANIGDRSTATLQIFDADSLFADINAPISAQPTAIWGDYNNDGKLDILGNRKIYDNTRIYDNNSQSWNEYGFSEFGQDAKYNLVSTDYDNNGWLDATLLKNNGNDTFKYEIYGGSDDRYGGAKFTLGAVLPNDLSSAIVQSSWADYNNDGRPDLLFNKIGSYPDYQSFTTLYRNTGAIDPNPVKGFQDSKARLDSGEPLFGTDKIAGAKSSGVWADYDNDGKLDILIEVEEKNSQQTSSGQQRSEKAKLYRNLGDGVFQDTGLSLPDLGSEFIPSLTSVSDMAWGDYNNDGKLDILLTGNVTSANGSSQLFTKVYKNTTSTNGSASFEDIGAQIPGLSIAQAAWGDYDNDGKLDILVTGWKQENPQSLGTSVTKIYKNKGDFDNPDSFTGPNSFTDSGAQIDSGAGPGNEFEAQSAWGDYDKDGKLDILLTGYSKNYSTSTGIGLNESDYFTKVFRNNTEIENTRPNPPTPLPAEVSGRDVTFKWNRGTDEQTPELGLSYNLRVVSTSGGLSPMSLSDGTRQVVGLGNVSQNTQWQLKDLPRGTYNWGVQSIDTAWAGSFFAEGGTFTIENSPPQEKIRLSGRYTDLNQPIKDVYTDPDGDAIWYQLTLEDGTPLPASSSNTNWLGLQADSWQNTITFFGEPPSSAQPFKVKLIATDYYGGSSEQIFTVTTKDGRWVIDGYISGATVFLDANKNGIKDTNEPSTTTDSGGKFNLNIPFDIFDTNKNGEIDPEEGHLVAIGGTDTATGLPLETPVTAPPDSTVVTLLTSLVADLIDKGIAPEEAQSLIKAALSLPAEVDLTSLDPILATNNNQPGGVQVLAAMVKVQNFITQTAASIDGASSASTTDIVKAVVSSIANQAQSGAVLNLSNAAVLAPIIQQSAAKIQQIDPSFNSQQFSQIIPQAATVMAAANQRIDTAVSNPAGASIPEAVARVQQVALGATSQDFKAIGAGNKTISQVVAENTGAALDTQIQAVTLPVGIATPVVTGDADLGSNSGNPINGTNGDDILTGTSSNDVLMGMRGNDSLDGAIGNDTIFGGKGFDTLLGNSGDDALYAGRGADNLNGGDGNDIVLGGKGDDLLNGGSGNDTLTGGMGLDKFLLSSNSGTDTITDFEMGKDLFVLGNGLTFSQLAVVQENSQTFIRIAQTGENLAILNGITANSIGSVNFGSL